MHDYSINSNERYWVNVFIIGISLFFASLYFRITTTYQIQIPWFLETPSFLGLLSLLNILYTKCLWKKRIKNLHFSSIPNLNGLWEGEIKTSHDDFKCSVPCSILIRQDYSKITLNLRTQKSKSTSLSCSIIYQEKAQPEISYVFRNEPISYGERDLHIHIGTTILLLENENTLIGNYFSNPDRMTYGNISLKRN